MGAQHRPGASDELVHRVTLGWPDDLECSEDEAEACRDRVTGDQEYPGLQYKIRLELRLVNATCGCFGLSAADVMSCPRAQAAMMWCRVRSTPLADVWPVAVEHIAHTLFSGHLFSVQANGLVGDGQGVGDRVLGERVRV
jgi:hypothetical protein